MDVIRWLLKGCSILFWLFFIIFLVLIHKLGILMWLDKNFINPWFVHWLCNDKPNHLTYLLAYLIAIGAFFGAISKKTK